MALTLEPAATADATRLEASLGSIPLVPLLGEIVAEARWEATDLQLRWGQEPAAGLLRGRSAELSFSPLARDQLLAVALEQAAASLAGQPGGPDLVAFQLPQEIAPTERMAVLARLQDPTAAVPARAHALVEGWVRRFDDMRDLKGGPRRAARRLFEDAALNRRFWDDERIPADLTLRAVMLASADLLVERAAALRRDDHWMRRLWRRAAHLRRGGCP